MKRGLLLALLGGICLLSNKNKRGKRLGRGLLLLAGSPTASPLWRERLTMRTTERGTVSWVYMLTQTSRYVGDRRRPWFCEDFICTLGGHRGVSVLRFISDELDRFRKYPTRTPLWASFSPHRPIPPNQTHKPSFTSLVLFFWSTASGFYLHNGDFLSRQLLLRNKT